MEGGSGKTLPSKRSAVLSCQFQTVILHHPLHLARERSDASLRLRCGLRRTTSHKRRNGKWPKYHRVRLWRIAPDRPIRSSRTVSDSPLAAWPPPIERHSKPVSERGGNEKCARVSSTSPVTRTNQDLANQDLASQNVPTNLRFFHTFGSLLGSFHPLRWLVGFAIPVLSSLVGNYLMAH